MVQRSVLLACLVLWVLAQPVVPQLESVGAIDPFNFWEDSPQDEETTRIGLSTPDAEADRSTHRERRGSGGHGRGQSSNDAHGYGSVCSLENQCNELLGLACVGHGNRLSRCACAPSTPVYVSEGGAEKCVRPKELHEACVSDQECSYKNPNVQCVSFLCNCSSPFELTAEKLCQLPSGAAGNIFTTAISVMLALALLLVVGGYAYQKKLRERERSSSLSTKPGLSVHADTSSTTSSTTIILGKGRPWGDKGESREDYSTRGRYNLAGRLRTPSEQSLPLHPPRYIPHKDAGQKESRLPTVPECCSMAERSSASLSGSVSPRSTEEQPRTSADTPLHRTLEQQEMFIQETRHTKFRCNGLANSSPIQPFLVEEEQMRRILKKDPEVVVTVETQKDRQCLRTVRDLPPELWIRSRRPPPSELTEGSLRTKDRKRLRRVFFMGGRSEDVSVTASTTSERRRSAPASAATGSESGSLVRCPAPPPTAVDGVQDIARPPGMAFAAVHGCSAAAEPAEQPNATVEPMRSRLETSNPTTESTADDRMSDVLQEVHGAIQAPMSPSARGETSTKEGKEDKLAEGPRYSTKRTSFSNPAESTVSEGDAKTNFMHSLPEGHLLHVDQSEQNTKGTSTQQGALSVVTPLDCAAFAERSNNEESTKEVCVGARYISRAFLHDPQESQTPFHTKPLKDTRDGASSTEVSKFKADFPESRSAPEACVQADEKKQSLNSLENVLADTVVGLQPAPISSPKASSSTVSLLREDEHLPFNAKTPDLIQAGRIEIEQIAQIAGLLSTVIGTPVGKARALSLDDSTNTDLRHLSTVYACPGDANHKGRPAPSSTMPGNGRTEQSAALTTTDVKKGARTQRLPAQTKRQGSLSDQHSQNAYREYMAKHEPPVHFTERPLADVLASLDSEMTSVAKDEQKYGMRRQKAPGVAKPKPPGTVMLHNSTQYGINDEDFGEVAIERSSGEGTEGFSRGLAFIYNVKGAAVGPTKRPVRFLGPVSSRNIVVLPESSVAICLPEGTSRDDLWTAASGTSLRQSFAAGGSALRHRHLLLASTLEDPTFESIYNAVLLPQLIAQEASGESGDVPSRPARSTSSSRAVSFDNSPTVVPLEPPPDPFAQCDVSKAMADTGPAHPPRPRRHSSVCRSSSGSLIQEMAEAADVRAARGARNSFRRRLEPENASDSNVSAESPVLVEADDLSW